MTEDDRDDIRAKAKEIMIRAKGYSRPGRSGKVERGLMKNFSQRTPARNYSENYDAIRWDKPKEPTK